LLYSVPSTLALLAEQPELGRRPLTALTRVLYAGEPYAVPRLRALMRALPGARLHNLFGPTETNVCLAYALPPRLPRDATAVPIGTPCDHLQVALLDPRGQPARAGEEGEVCVAGPSVLLGYHGLPDRSRDDFWPAGTLPGLPALFRTGDHARRDADGLYWFAGRRDRLVKHRGYRIDLGEIEAALALVPGVRESAVTTAPDGRGGIEIRAHVAPAGEVDLTVLAVKSHCGRHLPPYMVPATVAIVPELPRTATGKLDLLRLR
jgi:acyl-coenzyme A synthetase/AMP-(fatty) acid ligase